MKLKTIVLIIILSVVVTGCAGEGDGPLAASQGDDGSSGDGDSISGGGVNVQSQEDVNSCLLDCIDLEDLEERSCVFGCILSECDKKHGASTSASQQCKKERERIFCDIACISDECKNWCKGCDWIKHNLRLDLEYWFPKACELQEDYQLADLAHIYFGLKEKISLNPVGDVADYYAQLLALKYPGFDPKYREIAEKLNRAIYLFTYGTKIIQSHPGLTEGEVAVIHLWKPEEGTEVLEKSKQLEIIDALIEENDDMITVLDNGPFAYFRQPRIDDATGKGELTIAIDPQMSKAAKSGTEITDIMQEGTNFIPVFASSLESGDLLGRKFDYVYMVSPEPKETWTIKRIEDSFDLAEKGLVIVFNELHTVNIDLLVSYEGALRQKIADSGVFLPPFERRIMTTQEMFDEFGLRTVQYPITCPSTGDNNCYIVWVLEKVAGSFAE